LIESSGKIISIDDTEDSAVDIQIDAYIQISPGVDLGLLAGNEDLVSLEEDTLRDATVLKSVLQDMQSVIIEVIVNSAFADAIVLIGVLYNGLLEIGLEVQHLLVMLEPLGSDSRNSIVLVSLTSRDAS